MNGLTAYTLVMLALFATFLFLAKVEAYLDKKEDKKSGKHKPKLR